MLIFKTMSLEGRELPLQAITLKQALIETTFEPGRIYRGPDIINLSTLQSDIEEIQVHTSSHPNGHEAAKIIYITQDGKVLINKKPILGGDRHVGMYSDFYVNPTNLTRATRQDKFIGSIAHSHPYDSPFSPSDLLELFYGDHILEAGTSVLLTTPQRIMLVFRGQDTPQMEKSDAQMYLSELDTAVLRRIAHFINPNMPAEAQQNISIRANRAMFGQIITKHDLQVFEGNVGNRFLNKKEAEFYKT